MKVYDQKRGPLHKNYTLGYVLNQKSNYSLIDYFIVIAAFFKKEWCNYLGRVILVTLLCNLQEKRKLKKCVSLSF